MADDYDLVPHSELKKLEGEISDLKHKPGLENADGDMKTLSRSIQSMISIFNEAKEELRIEDEEKELLSKKVDPMLKHLEDILDQNGKIAEGILSLADMIKKLDAKVIALEMKVDDKQESGSSDFGANNNANKNFQSFEKPLNQGLVPPPGMPPQQNMQPPMQNQNQNWQQQPLPGMPPVQNMPPPQGGNMGMMPPPGFPGAPAQGQAPPPSGAGSDDLFAPPSNAGPASPSGGDDLFKTDAPGMPPPPPPKPEKKGFFGK